MSKTTSIIALLFFFSGCVSIGRYHRDMATVELYGESKMLLKAVEYQTTCLTNYENLDLLKGQISLLRMRQIFGNKDWDK